MPTTHLLYLHGFRSSPQSTKARQMAACVLAKHPGVVWWCPPLPPSPAQAMAMLMQGISGWPAQPGFQGMAVIGSSLGGFYADRVAGQAGCKAVLLNPAVHPARDLASQVGEQTTWHNHSEKFLFRPDHVEELRQLEDWKPVRPENCLAIIAKGDEVLDWREMNDRYAGARIKLLQGGDHALSDFENHLPDILDFLQLA